MADHSEADPEWIPRTREISNCPCKSWRVYESCCMPFHYGRAKPETAEELMRSRYSAYFFRLVDYLVETTHPDTRAPTLREELDAMVGEVKWSGLSVVDVVKGTKEDKVGKVEFVAEYYLDGEPQELHERSRFKKHKGMWKYLDGKS